MFWITILIIGVVWSIVGTVIYFSPFSDAVCEIKSAPLRYAIVGPGVAVYALISIFFNYPDH